MVPVQVLVTFLSSVVDGICLASTFMHQCENGSLIWRIFEFTQDKFISHLQYLRFGMAAGYQTHGLEATVIPPVRSPNSPWSILVIPSRASTVLDSLPITRLVHPTLRCAGLFPAGLLLTEFTETILH